MHKYVCMYVYIYMCVCIYVFGRINLTYIIWKNATLSLSCIRNNFKDIHGGIINALLFEIDLRRSSKYTTSVWQLPVSRLWYHQPFHRNSSVGIGADIVCDGRYVYSCNRYYCDITWASGLLKSQAHLMLIQQLVQDNIKEDNSALLDFWG